jgi:CBS-domain-containing membrane protein
MRAVTDEIIFKERTVQTSLPRTFHPDPAAQPYRADPASTHRVKFDARVDFTRCVEAKDFLLDIAGDNVSPERLAEMIVSAMNLLRAGPVTITAMRIVRRGEHQDG